VYQYESSSRLDRNQGAGGRKSDLRIQKGEAELQMDSSDIEKRRSDLGVSPIERFQNYPNLHYLVDADKKRQKSMADMHKYHG